MSKKTILPQSRRHILLYNEDWEYLETRFGPKGIKPVGISNVIRALVHRRVLAWREAENEAMTARSRNLSQNLSQNLEQTHQTQNLTHNSRTPEQPTHAHTTHLDGLERGPTGEHI